MKRFLATILALAIGLSAASAARADTAPPGTVTAAPANVGAPSHLLIDAKGTAAGFGASFPQAVTIALYKGFSLDLAAADRCSDADAAAGTCPIATRIASGTISGNLSLTAVFNQPLTAPVGVFLANATGGDLADVVIEVTVAGKTQAVRGQLVGVRDPTFGYELRIDPLPMVMAPLAAITVSLGELSLDIGASTAATLAPPPGQPKPKPTTRPKTKKCAHGRRGARCRKAKPKAKPKPKPKRTGRAVTVAASTHDLLTNPATCAGSWPIELRVRYADHTQTVDAAIACTS